ncbi:MAG: hypothetical protein IV090_16785 [Candidatus Sericytochromatia bacterium]|nr:hypothetical protein [Candidatus Sericytochromatia bacterium]
MYEEPHLEICYGPMKSGKSRYLVQKAEALFAAGIPFLAFKPRQDTRDGCFIRSRDSLCRDIQALGIDTAAEILPLLQTRDLGKECDSEQDALHLHQYLPAGSLPQACLIDEVFLLDSGLLAVIRQLSERGISVYLSGLDRDFRREYFPLRDYAQTGVTMQALIEICKSHQPLHASCEACGADAPFTQRLVNGQPAHYTSPTVLIGDEEYQPRCKAHHEVVGHPQLSLAS